MCSSVVDLSDVHLFISNSTSSSFHFISFLSRCLFFHQNQTLDKQLQDKMNWFTDQENNISPQSIRAKKLKLILTLACIKFVPAKTNLCTIFFMSSLSKWFVAMIHCMLACQMSLLWVNANNATRCCHIQSSATLTFTILTFLINNSHLQDLKN